MTRRKAPIIALAVATTASAVLAALLTVDRTDNADVLRLAYSLDGGGYCALNDTGVPATVSHKGISILNKSKGGTYCCGFTFWVAVTAAAERGLLDDKDPYELKRFQRECYGATAASADPEIAMAMEDLGIGRRIDPHDAKPGDFLTFQRIKNSPGHSAVFLDWVRDQGTIVGVRYRSSQRATDGVGDVTEYFAASRYRGAAIDQHRFYICRLSPARKPASHPD